MQADYSYVDTNKSRIELRDNSKFSTLCRDLQYFP